MDTNKELVNLATHYRPKTFSEMVGQEVAVAALKRIAMADGIAARSIFLKAPYGSGKSTVARLFGRAMNCHTFKQTGDVCNECEGCIECLKQNSQLYYEFDSSMVGNVEFVRNLTSLFQVAPRGRRVVVMDEVHAVSRVATTALLKIVEEGIKGTIFVFASTEDILETLKSRSIYIEFGTLHGNQIKRRVKEVADHRGIEISEEHLDLIAIKSKGHMRDALSVLQYYEMVGEDALQTSYNLIRTFIFRCYSKSNKAKALDIIPEIMSYNLVDVRDSIHLFIKNVYTADEGTPEYALKRTGAGNNIFNFFFSPTASQAFREEIGIELLLRSFHAMLS